MTNNQTPVQNDDISEDSIAKVSVFDHIKIIDEETGEQLVNKRG